MQKYIISLIIYSILPISDFNEDYLRVFEGEWKGTLTYLNYGDDETLVNLSLTMEAEFKNDQLLFNYYYDEGNGQIEKRTGKFKILETQVVFNGKWDVEKTELISKDSWNLILTSKGKDNNRPADFRKTVEVQKNKIVTTKWVKYEGASDYFMRNKHEFVR